MRAELRTRIAGASCVRRWNAGRASVLLLKLTAFVVGALSFGCDQTPELPVLEAPEWIADSPGAGTISPIFRTEVSGGDRLLMKTNRDNAVYVYSASDGGLTLTSTVAWDQAKGEIGGSCGILRGLSNGPRLAHEKKRLLADGRRVRTAGNVVLTFRPSPDENYLAVLSAKDRWRLGPIFPGLGGGHGGPSGQHYHELFTVPELRRVGKAVPLAITLGHGLKTCWSPDGRFVVYTDISDPRMVVIPIRED